MLFVNMQNNQSNQKAYTMQGRNILHSRAYWATFVFSAIFLLGAYEVFVPAEKEAVALEGKTPSVSVMAKAEGKTVAPEPIPVNRRPSRIVIDEINVDTPIARTETSAIADLDKALHEGVVRYPGTGLLGEERAMFLFGHSSYLPIVRNQAFKAFNNLQKLEEGDVVRVYSSTHEFMYRVSEVSLVDADEALVTIEPKKKLVLSTCNSFGEQSERYVVEADFVGARAL